MSSYLKAFSTQAEYETYMAGSPLLPNVSLIGEGEGEVAYNPLPPVRTVGMICYYNGSKLDFCSKDDWNNSLGTAIGVVVVPSDHTPDGNARVMSLKAMRYDTPDMGGDNQGMLWGGYGYDAGLTKYTRFPKWNNTVGGTISASAYGNLPSDFGNNFTGATCACDSQTKYASKGDYIPSTYLEDGTRNTALDTVVISGYNNVLSDFNGKSNTTQLLSLATAQTGWQTASTITNSGNEGYYPAACCCWRYSTPGTSQGDWYLPACGELAYVITRRGLIEQSIIAVGGMSLSLNQACIGCSTECDGEFTFSINIYSGYASKNYKTSMGFYVRGFLSVK